MNSKADDGQDRAHARGWELDRPTDLRPPPATTSYHEKVTSISFRRRKGAAVGLAGREGLYLSVDCSYD